MKDYCDNSIFLQSQPISMDRYSNVTNDHPNKQLIPFYFWEDELRSCNRDLNKDLLESKEDIT